MIIFYQQSLLSILLQKEDQQIKNHLYQRRTLLIRLPGVFGGPVTQSGNGHRLNIQPQHAVVCHRARSGDIWLTTSVMAV